MRFFSTIALGAATFITAAIAQSSDLAFTSTPASATAGKPVTIKFNAENKDQAITITLRQGPPDNLKDVTTLTTSASGGEYIWTPSESLKDGSDYALQITQGQNKINYSGQFSVTGGNGSGASSSSSSSSSASSSSSSSSTSGYKASSASASASILPIITGSHSGNASHTATGTASQGTGMNMSRNTTMSSATLTSGSRTSSSDSEATDSSDASGSGAGFQGSSTSSASASPSDNAASSVITGSSPFALILCAVAAIVY